MGKNDQDIFVALTFSLVCFGTICFGSGIYSLVKVDRNSTGTRAEKWTPACFVIEGVMSLITPLVCLIGYRTKNVLLMCVFSGIAISFGILDFVAAAYSFNTIFETASVTALIIAGLLEILTSCLTTIATGKLS